MPGKIATYTHDPTSSDNDAVRFLIQDTDPKEALLEDAEIAWLIAQTPNVHLAAASAARTLGARFAQQANTTIGSELRVDFSARADNYFKLAETLEKAATGGAIGPLPDVFAGGLSIADKKSAKDDSDLVQPAIERGMHDHPGLGQADQRIREN